MPATNTTTEGNDLVITRRIDAAPEAVWAALTEPEQLSRWFAPRPWRVTAAVVEPQPGGAFDIRMEGPDGAAEDCAADAEGEAGGCVLVAEPPRRLVWTDALSARFRPARSPFMTAELTLVPEAGGTRLTARVLHASAEDRDRHAAMGFAEGWGATFGQLAELVE